MALTMTRPTRRNGEAYLVRVAIPEPYREAAERLFGVRREFRENLKTTDSAEARRRAPAALERLRAKLERVRRAVEEVPETPGARDIAALAGEHYRKRAGAYGGPEIEDLHMEVALNLVEENPAGLEGDSLDVHQDLSQEVNADRARKLLEARGFSTDGESVRRLTVALIKSERAYLHLLRHRADGDWSPDQNLAKFPSLRPGAPPKPPTVAFSDLLAGWARDHGFNLDAKPIARAAYDRLRTLDRFKDFLGHDNAAAVTKADAVRWKEAMQEKARAVATIRNDLSEMSAVWRWGIRNGKLKDNPFEGVSPPKERGKKRQRRAFTEAEAALILTEARANKGYMRWLPWVCCLTGARISEICQSTKADVTEIDGVPVLRITDEGDADQDTPRSLKNEDSRRDVPIHPALIAEGFLDYVRGLPSGSPLFPDAKPDKVFGLRSTIAGKKMSRWLRNDLDITDSRISPNHSWRHYFIGACRKIGMNVEVRSALTGHSAKMDESAGYGDGMKTFVHLLAENIAKVPSPVMPLEAGQGARVAAGPIGDSKQIATDDLTAA